MSAEVVAEDVEGMLREGRAFAKLAPNIVVKVPMSEEGLEAISRFADEGIKTNCTLIFTSNQGRVTAGCGATEPPPLSKAKKFVLKAKLRIRRTAPPMPTCMPPNRKDRCRRYGRKSCLEPAAVER